MFENRQDAGRKLAEKLMKFKDRQPLVLAIPRGGVEVGFEVARKLDADFSILVARKLPYPDNPEAGFGAVVEDGSFFIFPHAYHYYDKGTINRIIAEQKQEVERRIRVLRDGETLPHIKGRVVILVDDGIAMGSTMRASIAACRNLKAEEIIVAAPVTSNRVKSELQDMVSEVIILETPSNFRAVAQVYRHWYDVPDEEAVKIYRKWEKEYAGSLQ
ncbi:MAG: phosphoribosyltransferase [Vulcanimicrobiota bacterium]